MKKFEDEIIYARAIDLSFFDGSHGVNIASLKRRKSRTQELYDQLSEVPGRQKISETNDSNHWREHIQSGELTIEQLRELLYVRYGVDYYTPDRSEFEQRLREQELNSAQRLRVRHLNNHIEALIDRTLHEEVYPAIIAARDYKNLRILVVPDGTTDEFCYEFSSLKNSKSWEGHLNALRVAAHLDAYLINRPNIFAHIHVRGSGREEMVREPVNRALAHNYLDYVRYNLTEMAKGKYWQKFDPIRSYAAENLPA